MQRVFFVLAYYFTCSACSGQQYPFVYYTPKDGLVNSRVRIIKQDSRGRMYFITYGGLSVYDGTRFINYTMQEGLPNDLVNDVLEITPDSLLIATNIGKLNTMVGGKIRPFPLADNSCPLVNRFLKSKDGKIYAASDDGLYLLEGNRFTRLPVLDKQGKDIGIYFDRILEWQKFFLIIPWNNRKEKLILFDRANRRTADVITTTKVVSTKMDKQGNILVTTPDGVRMLDLDSLHTGRLKLVKAPAVYAPISQEKNVAIYFDKAGNAWVFAGNSMRKISPQGAVQIISPEHGLKSGPILDIFEDREGIMWMATDGNGVIKMRGGNIQLLNSFPPNYPISVSCIQEENDTLWLYNVLDNLVCRVHGNELRKFPLPGGDKFNGILIHGQSIFLFSQQKIIAVANKDEPSSYRRPATIFRASEELMLGSAVIDPFGAIILVTTRSDTVFSISVLKDGKILSESRLSILADQLHLDKQQRLWAVTRDNHLLLYALYPKTPSRYLEMVKDFSKELPPITPRAFTFDPAGHIWIGTRYDGVYRFELSGQNIVSKRKFTTHDGLTDNFVYNIVSGDDGQLWVGTQSGLDKIFLKNDQYIISNISKSNNYFQTIHQISVTEDGTVWALTGEGTILKVTRTPASAPPAAPSLLLTLLEVNSNPFMNSSARFTYRQNNFTFNAAAPSFFDEKSILYSYRLEGSGNSNWSTPSQNPIINFSNLPPGEYVLNARAQFPEAMYDPQSARFSFIILPPWWQTWWFRTIAGLFVVWLLFAMIRFYYRRKLEQQKATLEKQQAIEKERTRIATDMHDDLGAGLSRIKFLSELIGIKKQKHQPIEEDITKIREYSHEMIDKMGEIVWALNEKNDSLSDLLSYTRSYAVEYLSQNGIQCTTRLPDQLPSGMVSGEFRRNIFLAVKEALHNVVKHSQASHVTITVELDPELTIVIRDDGMGFDPEEIRPFSNGLANIKKRMQEIGGSMKLHTTGGTTVRLEIPLAL